MADISMCSGKDCPLKDKCYRYTAPQSDYQSWFSVVPYSTFVESCEYFWDNKGYKNDK